MTSASIVGVHVRLRNTWSDQRCNHLTKYTFEEYTARPALQPPHQTTPRRTHHPNMLPSTNPPSPRLPQRTSPHPLPLPLRPHLLHSRNLPLRRHQPPPFQLFQLPLRPKHTQQPNPLPHAKRPLPLLLHVFLLLLQHPL